MSGKVRFTVTHTDIEEDGTLLLETEQFELAIPFKMVMNFQRQFYWARHRVWKSQREPDTVHLVTVEGTACGQIEFLESDSHALTSNYIEVTCDRCKSALRTVVFQWDKDRDKD